MTIHPKSSLSVLVSFGATVVLLGGCVAGVDSPAPTDSPASAVSDGAGTQRTRTIVEFDEAGVPHITSEEISESTRPAVDGIGQRTEGLTRECVTGSIVFGDLSHNQLCISDRFGRSGTIELRLMCRTWHYGQTWPWRKICDTSWDHNIWTMDTGSFSGQFTSTNLEANGSGPPYICGDFAPGTSGLVGWCGSHAISVALW